jgi:hypothetical protein
MKIMAIGGEPATGKTTLIFELIKSTDDWQVLKPEKLLDIMYSKNLNLVILGKYENDGNIFQGTDRLSMAVQPDAVKFLQSSNSPILFEGDRLFNSKFIAEILKVTEDFKILILEAPQSVIDKRHVDRNDNQSDQFKNGRKTKIANITSSLELLDYIEFMNNSNKQEQQRVLSYVKNFFDIKI